MRKKTLIIIIAIVAAIGIGGTAYTVSTGVFDPYEQQIKLGYKLLAEGQYEEAILAFNKAIEIDVKKDKAYVGLADTYTARLDEDTLQDTKAALQNGFEQHYNDENIILTFVRLAEGLFDNSHEEWAIELLNFGYDLTSDERIVEMKTELLNRIANAILKDLYELFANNDEEGVKRKIQSEKYVQLMALIDESYKVIYFPNEDSDNSGKGVAIYYVASAKYGNVFVYYGDFIQGERSGNGTWVGAKENQYYWFEGTWNDDAPNGYGDVKEWNANLDSSVAIRNLSGNLTNGLWNGDMNWNFITSDSTDHWVVNFVNGIVTIQERNPDGGSIWSRGEKGILGSSKDDYGNDNKIYGIVGYANYED